MIVKHAVQSILGSPDEDGERYTNWTASNGKARFRICLHISGEADVLLLAGRHLLIWRGDDGLQFFRLVVGLGIVDARECAAMGVS